MLALCALTGLVLVLLDGYHAWSGPEVLAFSSTHGLHLVDLPILAVWAAGVWFAWKLWRRP